ncbi:MAG: hypothetical protein GXP25_15540 [Planctomycetes bacterium]|nr:hypothetical protein [Planctomycetota bacterium]
MLTESNENVASSPQKTTTHDVGAILASGKPYFPMILGNGVEHALIGYAGAMGACSGHEQWAYGNTLSEHNQHGATFTGWFRPDPRRRPMRGVLNLLQCGYIVRKGVHADGIDLAGQRFDARSGILETRCHMGYAELQVTTFLTRDHLLVHRFAGTARGEDVAMQFFVQSAFPMGPLRVAIRPTDTTCSASSSRQRLDFTIEGEDWPSTPGRLICDHAKARRVECYNRKPGIEVPLDGEFEFSFVIQCSHAQDAPPVPLLDHFDYESVLRRHRDEWQKFDARSNVRLAHGELDDLYRTSLYVVRAHQDPDLGGITVGGYPGMWSSGINTYDVSYGLMALLGANRMAEAERVVQFWKRILPALRKRARDAGLPGVACPAPLSSSGEVEPQPREKILEERHFITANIALHVWQLYQYSGRLSVLRDYWDCLVEPLEFLLGACVEEFDDHAEIIRSSGPNGKERIEGKVVYYPNPIRTLLATIEAVRAVCDAAKLLGREIDPRWERLLPKLERGIEANRFDGLVRASRNPKAAVRADASYVGLFDCLVDEKTLLAEVDEATGPEGLMRWWNHGYRAVPWMHLNVSAAFSRLGMADAARVVEIAVKFTTTLGGIPEAVRPDGIYSKTWYPTVHGGFAHAVDLLLVRRRDDVVELFAGVPADWGDVSFEQLRAPVGMLVSASRTDGRIAAEVTNDSDSRQCFRVRAGGTAPWEEAVTLDPGETAALPRRGEVSGGRHHCC